MVHIQNEIAATLASKIDGKVPKSAKIELTKQLPSELQGKIINAKVSEKLDNGNYKLLLKDGKTIEAKITPSPKIGSQISFISLKNGENKITEMVVDDFQKNDGDGKQTKQNNSQSTESQIKGQQTNAQKLVNEAKIQLTEKLIQETATNIKPVIKNDPFKQLRPLIGQSIPLSTISGKALPNLKNVISVVVSKPENGLQTLQPQAVGKQNIPPFQAKFPTIVPEGTVLKMNISNGNGKILDITPPKEVPIQAPKTQAKTVQLTKNVEQSILLTSRVIDFESPLPKGSEINIKIISTATKLPDIIQTTTLINGEIKAESIPQFSHSATTTGGTKITVVGQTTIPEGTEMAIKIIGINSADILQINKDSSVGERQPQHQFGSGDKKQQSQPQLKIGSQHTGTITAQGEGGRLTLSFSDGKQIEVKANTALPIGTKLTIKINEFGDAQIISTEVPPAVAKATALTHLSNDWKTMLESLNALKFANSEAGNQLKNKIPTLEKDSFLPNLITFIDAVNNKSMERLAGNETLNLLKALGIDFSIDMSNLHAATQKTADNPDSWRSLLFPYMENKDSEPKQGGFFWHNQEDEEGNAQNTRFIIHLDISSVGAVQLDGFIQESDIKLKLKTGSPLTQEHQQGLKSVVRQILEKLDLTGDINILEEKANSEKPLSLAIKKAEQFKVTI